MANSKSTLILRPNHRPSGRVGEIARKDLEVDGDQCVAESSPSSAGAEPLPRGTFDGAQSNGDEGDVRMAEIEEILGHAAMHLLDKCTLVAEWVRYAEAKLSVFGQIVPKPKGGRPEGGVARAGREPPVPGKSDEARRKFVERALKIDGIWPEVKVAARAAGLDDTQSALLAIASEHSQAAQLAKVQEITARKAMPRRKSSARDGNEHTASSAAQSGTTSDTNPRAQDAVDIPELAAVCNETSTVEEEAQLAADLIRDLAHARDAQRKIFGAIVRHVQRREAKGRAEDMMEQIRRDQKLCKLLADYEEQSEIIGMTDFVRELKIEPSLRWHTPDAAGLQR